MEIIGIAKRSAPLPGGQKTYICHLVESELDKVTGVAGKTHITGRYKPGARVNLGKIYNKVKHINEKMAEIKAAAAATKIKATEIEEAFPLEN